MTTETLKLLVQCGGVVVALVALRILQSTLGALKLINASLEGIQSSLMALAERVGKVESKCPFTVVEHSNGNGLVARLQRSQ